MDTLFQSSLQKFLGLSRAQKYSFLRYFLMPYETQSYSQSVIPPSEFELNMLAERVKTLSPENGEEIGMLGQLLFDLLKSVEQQENLNQQKATDAFHNALLRIHEEEKSQKEAEEKEMNNLLDAMGK